MTEKELNEIIKFTKQEITVDVLENICEHIYQLKNEAADLEKRRKAANNEKETFQQGLKILMEKLEIDSYPSKSGTISKRDESKYRLLPDDESRNAFFKYLKDKEIFETMISINSRTLQSFVKQEVELLENEGKFGVLPDGIEETDVHTVFSLRKK